jgi:hypothetical protein
MTLLHRTLAGVATAAFCVLAAAGVYTEATRIPDQP